MHRAFEFLVVVFFGFFLAISIAVKQHFCCDGRRREDKKESWAENEFWGEKEGKNERTKKN
jgi:hypothetical protein